MGAPIAASTIAVIVMTVMTIVVGAQLQVFIQLSLRIPFQLITGLSVTFQLAY